MLIITQDRESIINMDKIVTINYGFADIDDYKNERVRVYAETLTENPYTLGKYYNEYEAKEVLFKIAKAHNDNQKVFEMPYMKSRIEYKPSNFEDNITLINNN